MERPLVRVTGEGLGHIQTCKFFVECKSDADIAHANPSPFCNSCNS
jgi:hypothetical protein